MAKKITWAFIFVSEGADPIIDNSVMEHNGNKLITIGVETIEEGCRQAKRIVDEENCLLIELCGGFKKDGAQKVIDAVDGKAVVGHIEYLDSEIPKLKILE